MNDKLNDLATGLRSSLFASRDSIEDAFKYAYDMIETIPNEHKSAAYTALHVVVNTIALEIQDKG